MRKIKEDYLNKEFRGRSKEMHTKKQGEKK